MLLQCYILINVFLLSFLKLLIMRMGVTGIGLFCIAYPAHFDVTDATPLFRGCFPINNSLLNIFLFWKLYCCLDSFILKTIINQIIVHRCKEIYLWRSSFTLMTITLRKIDSDIPTTTGVDAKCVSYVSVNKQAIRTQYMYV